MENSNFEKLQALPVIERIIITVSMLSRFQQKYLERGSVLGLTRTQQDQACMDKGKSISYRDTLHFVTKLFEAEIQEEFKRKEAENDNNRIQGWDTGSRQTNELGDDADCDNQNIPDGNP